MSIIDAYSILWADLMVLKRRIARYLVTTLVSPLLYLVAFGWGLGRGISVDGASYFEFVVPGIIALTAMNSSFNGAGTRLNVDRLFFKSFDECLMAPISLLSLLLGKAMIGVVRGLISSTAFMVVALLIAPAFSVGPLFLVSLLVTCLAFAFLGVLAALLAKSHEDMATFGSLILLPMTFLGGTFFSVSQVPEALKFALYALPLTHSSLCLRAAALGQPFPWESLLAIGSFWLIFFVGCNLVLKRASV
jgi:ABC-2 type transport system permease protein